MLTWLCASTAHGAVLAFAMAAAALILLRFWNRLADRAIGPGKKKYRLAKRRQ